MVASELVTRREITGAVLGCTCAMAVLPLKPVFATAAALVSDWNGFAKPPRWQSFNLITGDTIVLPSYVAGISVDAILDSGSAASIVSTSLAARLNLASTEQVMIRGIGGRASVQLARNVELTLAGQPRRLPFVVIADLEAVSSAIGRPVDVVLGEDMLVERCIALEFASSRISIGDSGTFSGGRGWQSISVAHGSNRELLVVASVAGLPDTPMLFDLGSSTALMLDRAYVEEHRLLDGVRQSTAAIGGVDGTRLAAAFIANEVKLGGFPVRSVPTLAPSSWASKSALGSIGFPLISQFDVVLDVSGGKIWLRPARRGLPMLEDHSGFGLAPGGNELSIVHVAANSPAASDGWRARDRILAINGHRIDASYIRGQHWRWRFMPPGTLVILQDQAGRMRELRLVDYF
ncbi:aspartyl protease family protein [Sphingomonas sp. TX0543]|uniref:aspartyl protease family protein n=1 Tax=Sphingomonas sp. TX0543 TaxID=3399682 RepID=UPI003AFA24A3